VAAAWAPYAVAGGIAVVTAVAGMVLTRLDDWYYALRKPSWQPPEWLFGPAWTLIFILAVVSAGMAWNAADQPATRAVLLIGFSVNVVLNMAWSWLFFTRRRLDLALLEVIPLWLSIAFLILITGALVPLAGWLLAPYLCWVSFAAFLNRRIWQLNRA